MKRVILHCDLNCFFASVEMLYHPEYKDVPMAIAGDPKDRHGIILAKNVPAKKAGVKTAETIADAKKKCPNLILRKPDYETYEYYSERIRDLYYEYTDQIEPFGIDECWLDITHSVSYFGSVDAIVNSLLFRAKNEIGLTLSIGVSYNKVYAKLGSDLAKEDSFCKIDSLEDIRHLPASSLLGVGKRCDESLKRYGIVTIGQVAEKSPEHLRSILGKFGDDLYRYANGLEDSAVSYYDSLSSHTVKSISNSMTSIRDINDMNDFKVILHLLCDDVARRLRRKGMYYKTVHLYLKTKEFKMRTIQTRLNENTDLSKTIYDNALNLFQENCDFAIPYRTIGVAVSDLSYQKDSIQTELFTENDGYSLRQKKEETAVEEIRRRFGKDVIASMRIYEDPALAKIVSLNNGESEKLI